jgi:hypothetical protein
MGLLNRGVKMLLTKTLANEGELVTYARGSNTVSLTAIRGKAELNIDKFTEVAVEGIDASWIIETADLIIDEAVVLPERMDLITDANGDKWEVTPIPNIGCYRNIRGMTRVFVKAVA